jgi:hypothetical protein
MRRREWGRWGCGWLLVWVVLQGPLVLAYLALVSRFDFRVDFSMLADEHVCNTFGYIVQTRLQHHRTRHSRTRHGLSHRSRIHRACLCSLLRT